MIDFGYLTWTVRQFSSALRFRYSHSRDGNRAAAASRGKRRYLVCNASARHVLPLLAVCAGLALFTGCAKKVAVPDVSQQDLDQAQKALTGGQLQPGNISGATGTGAYVVSQSPAAGQQVAANSKVDLVVEMPVTVPTLTGTNLTDAVTTLQGLDLKITFIRKPTVNPFGKTKVEQQDPAANSSVHRNAMVTLTVSTPPNVGALLGLVAKEPAYQNLKPEYKNVLDSFLGDPSKSRSMDSASNPPSGQTSSSK
jgi:beta-lactam-binding protein with PASTA domain